jgi:hypothetical protein
MPMLGLDVGLNARPRKSVDCLAERIVFTRGSAVREKQQVMAVDTHAGTDRLATSLFPHELRNAIDQDVLIVDRRKSLEARSDLDPVAIMLVTANLKLGPL